jgi:hypothetical protein
MGNGSRLIVDSILRAGVKSKGYFQYNNQGLTKRLSESLWGRESTIDSLWTAQSDALVYWSDEKALNTDKVARGVEVET